METKKELITRLIAEGKITIEEAAVLLGENKTIAPPITPPIEGSHYYQKLTTC